MARAQSPIKVHEITKEKVRYAALMAGLKQAELVERAVDEYVERHRDEFGRRMDQAREALLGGKASALAYSAGVSEIDEGGRVEFWRADKRVLELASSKDGVPVASAPRVFGDLTSFGGRGQDAAEHLKGELIDPLHQQTASPR
jgi:hypothetical protein